jgi:sulfur carrier protein ThiS
MSLQVRLAQVLQQYTDNQETVAVDGSTVRDCLNDLVIKYPDIKRWIFDANNVPMVIVLLNGEVVLPDELDKPITLTDKIELYHMIAGG